MFFGLANFFILAFEILQKNRKKSHKNHFYDFSGFLRPDFKTELRLILH